MASNQSEMSQTHGAGMASHLAGSAQPTGTSNVELRTSLPSSHSAPGDRCTLALGVVATMLAALKEASGLTPVPALRHATGLAIVVLESVQVRKSLISQAIRDFTVLPTPRAPKTTRPPIGNSLRMLEGLFWTFATLYSCWTRTTFHKAWLRTLTR